MPSTKGKRPGFRRTFQVRPRPLFQFLGKNFSAAGTEKENMPYI